MSSRLAVSLVLYVGALICMSALPGLDIMSSSASLPSSASSAVGTASVTDSVSLSCANEITSQFNSVLASVDSAKAIQLAELSPQFLASVAGHYFQFVSLGGVATYTPGTCGDNMTFGQLNVDFNVNGLTVSGSGVTVPEGVTVYENPSMSSVSNVTIDRTVQGINYWSGYEAHYVSGGQTLQLFGSNFQFTVPSVSYNSNCYYASPWQCEMSVWAGMSASSGGGGFLIQSGVDMKVPCSSTTSCSSTVYTAWYEWVPHNGATACGSSYPVYSTDSVIPYELNDAVNQNGNSNDYQAYVEDLSQSWVCGSGWYDIGSAAYYAQSIIETPANGCCPIPTSWGTLTIDNAEMLISGYPTNNIAYYTNSYVTVSKDTMYNYCTTLSSYIYNINVGALSGNGQYNQVYNNNCDH